MHKIHDFRWSFFSLLLSSLVLLSCGEGTPESKEVGQKEVKVPSDKDQKTVLFFGDSMTAGYGVEQEEAFPALIQDKIDSLGWDFAVINGGLSGETSASGLTRVDWFLEEEPAVFVLELGGNDGLRGIDLAETRKNLQGIIDKVKAAYPNTIIVLAGMQIPPNMGQEYTTEFKEIFPMLAEENDLALIPFLLEGVGGNSALNQHDGIHPTVGGHVIVANTVWKYLQPVLKDIS